MKNGKVKDIWSLIKSNIVMSANLALQNYRLITDLCLIVFPMGIVDFMFGESKSIIMITILLVQILLFIFKAICMLVRNEKEGFPVMNKRLTENINGEIRIKKGNLQEAVRYLYEVENYAERCGYMKK